MSGTGRNEKNLTPRDGDGCKYTPPSISGARTRRKMETSG